MKECQASIANRETEDKASPLHAKGILEHLDAAQEVKFDVIKRSPFPFEQGNTCLAVRRDEHDKARSETVHTLISARSISHSLRSRS